MSQFDEPMAGKGNTLLENNFLDFIDEQRKSGVCWGDIPLFRGWVEDEYARVKIENEKLKNELKYAVEYYTSPSRMDD
jgi:hypothetical protein